MGGLLFRARSWLPLPLLVAQLALAAGEPRWAALALVVAGEVLRLWAVGHIGRASRTRGDETQRVVDEGPYGRLRNPLYLGNWLIWTGVGALSGWPWALAWALWMAVQVHLVVLWEEENLAAGLGEAYARYRERVPRWLPAGPGGEGRWELGVALGSERSTLLAIGLVLALFALR